MELREPESELGWEVEPTIPETEASPGRDKDHRDAGTSSRARWAVPAGLGREATQLAHEVTPRRRLARLVLQGAAQRALTQAGRPSLRALRRREEATHGGRLPPA